MSDESRDREEIIAALDRYAEALDGRQWELLDRVFLPELDYDFVAWRARSRAEAVERIREALDGCGPTQHLLGNYRVTVDGDSATSAVYVRAFHLGIGSPGRVGAQRGGMAERTAQREGALRGGGSEGPGSGLKSGSRNGATTRPGPRPAAGARDALSCRSRR
ncbi:MAG: nuclear transport factor 2 family protein [Deltaproteobacteria bacterium]|nr:nuclear transport factor 2 family protein [Deltaproteobacteria bacterium]